MTEPLPNPADETPTNRGLSLPLSHLLLIGLSLLAVVPIYWMFVTSLRPANDIYSTRLWPAAPTWENYQFVFSHIPIVRMMFNTLVMSLAITATQLLSALLAAYAFARWRFLGDRLMLGLFALTWLVPFQVIMIPNYVRVANLGWLDTLTAIVVPQIASAFAVILLYQNLKGFPQELVDASRIDGASDWTILWRVITPNLSAALAALAILLFISAWNEYFWPLLVTRTLENSVVQIGLQMFLTQEGDLWGPMMAAASLASLPVLVLYLILQQKVIESFMKSGLR